MKAKLNATPTNKSKLLKEEGNIKIEALYNIILTKSGKPDYLAIDIYTEARSWFKPKKSIREGNVIYVSKLSGHGWQIGYEYLAAKHKCSRELIRTKLVLLEKLGLITREFRTERYHGQIFTNLMYILVWKDTPHFYSEIGLEKKVDATPENQGSLCQNSSTPIQENLDNIYRIPNNEEREEEPLGNSSSLSFSSIKTRTRAQGDKVSTISTPSFEKKFPKITTEVPTLAFGSVNEPAKVKDTLGSTLEPSCSLETTAESVTDLMPRMEQAEEVELDAKRLNMRQSNPGLKALQDISLLAGLLHQDQKPVENEEIPNTPTTEKIETNREATQMKEYSMSPEPIRNLPFELREAICKSFDSKRSDEILEHCKFNLLDGNRLSVQLSKGCELFPTDKELLRSCIKSVYGDEINIISAALPRITRIHYDDPLTPNVTLFPKQSVKWNQFKSELLKHFPESTGRHLIAAWFDKTQVSEDTQSKKIILTGSSFLISYISGQFGSAIEQTVKKNQVTLELHFEKNDERPIIYKPCGGF